MTSLETPSGATAVSTEAAWARHLRPLRWTAAAMTAGVVQSDDAFGLPIGTVTFLLTDVEGSTLAWSASPLLMGPAVARHYEILDAAVAAHGGVRPQEQGEGDSIVAAFSRASDALRAAFAAQRALAEEVWPDGLAPLKVRMAVHAGEAQLRNEANYVGQTIIRTARLRAIAHGGQIVVSQAARDLTVDQLGDEIELIDLGIHRLKDLARPEHVWQVVVPGMPREHPPLKSLDAVPNNLAVALSTFVGRRKEIDAVTTLCRSARLVTVTGPGGAGKTRLAQQVAADLAEHYPDGTWWIDLAPHDASAVSRVVADIVSVKDPDALAARLADSRVLLVFDNCEHVLDTVAPLIVSILETCPHAQILATSRGALNVPGEVTWRVPPLQLPAVQEQPSLEHLVQFDAVRLFVDRARRARPNFGLTNDNGPAVAEICSRLDGLPLAIELAAARAKSLTPQQILSGLEHSLRLLTGGSRLVMARQQTIEASIAWSHDLLAEPEQVLLRRISVFAGGWNLEAVEAICADGEAIDAMQVLDSLERLIDQSLVHVDDLGVATRYHVLETVRQFGAARLTEAGERDGIEQRHADHYVSFARAWAARCETAEEEVAIARLAPEHANIQIALQFLAARVSAVALTEVIITVTPMWVSCTQGLVGLAWFATALDRLPENDHASRARVLLARLDIRDALGQPMHTYLEAKECLALVEAHQLAIPVGRAQVAAALSAVAADPENGLALVRQGFASLESAGDRFGLARAKTVVSGMLSLTGDLITAQPFYDDARAAVEEIGNAKLISAQIMWEVGSFHGTGDHQAFLKGLATVDRLMPNWPPWNAMRAAAQVHFADDLGRPMPTEHELRDLHRLLVRTGLQWMAHVITQVTILRLHLLGEFEQAIAAADAAGDAYGPQGTRLYAAQSARAACAMDDYDGAEARMQPAEIRSPHVPSSFVAATQIDCLVALHRQQLPEAEVAARSALEVSVQQGRRRDIIVGFQQLATIAARQGSWAETARLVGVAAMLAEKWTLTRRTEPFNRLLDEAVHATRDALGQHGFDAAQAEGARLSLDDAVEFINRSRGERGRATIGWASLTPTERRVADLVRSGLSNAAVGAELLMGAETVKTHLSRVFAKLDVNNRTKLAALTPPAPG